MVDAASYFGFILAASSIVVVIFIGLNKIWLIWSRLFFFFNRNHWNYSYNLFWYFMLDSAKYFGFLFAAAASSIVRAIFIGLNEI